MVILQKYILYIYTPIKSCDRQHGQIEVLYVHSLLTGCIYILFLNVSTDDAVKKLNFG